MIAIEINGEFLKLEQSASIRFEKNFPTLFQELYQGDYSFPFTLNAEQNYKYLGFANIPESINKVLKFDCYIHMFGLPFSKATLIITKATKYKFSVNLSAGIKTLKTASKMLPEINYGERFYMGKFQDEIAAKATDISRDGDWTHYGFTFVPHINEDFYSGNNPDFIKVLNMVNPNTGDIYYNTTITGNKYSLVPFFFLHFILQKIFDQEGLSIVGSFWNSPEMKKLLVYNNKSLDSLNEIGGSKVKLINTISYTYVDFNATFSGSAIRVPFIKGPTDTYDEPFAYDNTTHEYTITQSGLFTFTINSNTIYYNDSIIFGLYESGTNVMMASELSGPTLPQSFPSEFTLNFNASVGDIGRKFYIGLRRWNLPFPTALTHPVVTISTGATVTITQSNINNLNLYSRYVDPKKHMKDISVEEFLLGLKQIGLEFSFDFNKNTVSVDFITNKINDVVAVDWTDKAVDDYEVDLDNYNKGYSVGYDFGTVDKLNENNFKTVDPLVNIENFNTFSELPTILSTGQTAYVKNMNQYFITSYDQYASPQYFWKKYTDFYYTKKYGDGETVVKTAFAPMLMAIGKNIAPSPNLTLETALMPASKCPGSSEMFNLGDNDFDLRLVFYRGQNQIGTTPNNKGGNYILANTTKFSLNGQLVGDFDFTQHLDSGFWVRFLDWIYERIANGQLLERDLRLNELDILNIDKTPKISIDGIIYLLKTISIMSGENLKLSKAKMLKL